LLGTYAGAFSVQTETKRISHTTKLAAETPSLLFSPPYRQSRLYVSKVEDAVRNLVTSNDIRDGKEDSSLPLKLTEFSKAEEEEEDNAAYKKSFAIISLITLFNASLSPVWHVVYQGNGPPPLFLNALVSVVAFAGLLAGAPLLDASMGQDSALAEASEDKWSKKSFRGGMELGLWKGLGTQNNIILHKRSFEWVSNSDLASTFFLPTCRNNMSYLRHGVDYSQPWCLSLTTDHTDRPSLAGVARG